uniref:N-carbamyl-L-cysteine amidohydrolase n=1 Tax=mine drainage metagenome TaxID=410659 RepID=E6QLB9_9ZZZZ
MPEHPQCPVNTDRLTRELAQLANISEAEPPIVTRVVFSEADLRARAFVQLLCTDAGLTLRHDAVGNTFARWQGTQPDLAPVATGSHIDAIPNAGAFDGTIGVLGALEAIRSLQQAGFQPTRPIELVLFTSEEPTRFGIGCLGSRLMGGVLSPDQALALRDPEGRSLDSLRADCGFVGSLESVRLAPGHFHAFVELHIEQGKTLEHDGLDIGIVTAIAAPAALWVTVQGEGGHAGAMLMPDRHDAIAAAAELVLALERAALATHSIDSVATVGLCEVFPGAVNSVPSRVRFSVDVRDTDAARRDSILRELETTAHQVSERRGVRITHELVNADPPALCDPATVAAVEAAAAEAGLKSRRMVSRAYHDSLFVARVAPVAMIFIPCRNGVSHRPDEYASPQWITAGVQTLAATLWKLSA